MDWEKPFFDTLAGELESRRQKNPRYSIRAFARDLGVAPATMSELLRGKARWKLGPDRAVEMLERMNLTPARRRRLRAILGESASARRQDIRDGEFDLLTDWKTSSILFAHSLPAEYRAPEKLARRFSIPVQDVQRICSELQNRGLLEMRDGVLCGTGANWYADSVPPVATVRAHHRAGLTRAVHAIEAVEPAERDLSTLTFTGSLKNIEEIRKEIRAFHERIRDLMNHDDGNSDVLQLSVALFPVRAQDEAQA